MRGASSSTKLDKKNPKKRRNRKGNVIPLTMKSVLKLQDEPEEGEEEENEDDFGLVAHARTSIGAQKAIQPMVVDTSQPRLDKVEEEISAQVPEPKGTEDVLLWDKEDVEETTDAGVETELQTS